MIKGSIYDAVMHGHPSQSVNRGLVDVTHMESIGPVPIVTHKGPNRKYRRAQKIITSHTNYPMRTNKNAGD